jgi:hypothetical protein
MNLPATGPRYSPLQVEVTDSGAPPMSIGGSWRAFQFPGRSIITDAARLRNVSAARPFAKLPGPSGPAHA